MPTADLVTGMHLAPIDIIIITIYMLGTLALGTYFAKYVKNAGDLFIAGKALPFWAIGMSIVVSDIGAFDFIAVSGEVYNSGIAVANFDWIGSMPAMVFAAFLFVPYYWRAGVYTIPEFLGRRYNKAVQLLHAAIWGINLLIGLSLMLWVTADKFMNTVLGWPVWFGIWVMVVIAGIYTFSGGLSAVVLTDVVQLIVMFVGGFALLFLAVWEVGGPFQLHHDITSMGGKYENFFTILLPNDTDTAFPWTGIVFGLGIVMATAYMSGNQAIVQRTLGARSEWDAKGGMLFGGFLKCFIPLMVAVPGLAAVLLVPGLESQDKAFPTMIRELLPPGLAGLMFAALLAALMSSIDSTLNSASTIWTTDIIGQTRQLITGRALDDKSALVVGRALTAVFIIGGGLVAQFYFDVYQNEGVYNFVQTIMSLFQGPVFAILLLGILWRRATQWGALAGLLLGLCFTTILHNTEGLFPGSQAYLFIAWWSFVFSLIVTVVVSLLTPPEPDEKIEGLVFGQVMKDGEIQRVIGVRANT